MPRWEYIEDSSAEASRVWFLRPKRRRQLPPASGGGASASTTAPSTTGSSSEDPNSSSASSSSSSSDASSSWKPLRKVDCQALNASFDPDSREGEGEGENNGVEVGLNASPSRLSPPIYIDGGRLAAYPKEGIARHNYLGTVEFELCSATWFRREEKSKKDVLLHPVQDPAESRAIEAFYQRVVQATSSLGEGLASVAGETVALPGPGDRKVVLNKSPLKLILKAKGWFAPQHDLQRGYGEYHVEGEEEEAQLGPVAHVVFVVHGIGEAFFNKQDVGIPSIVEQMNATRILIQKQQVAEYRSILAKFKPGTKDDSDAAAAAAPTPPDRIEIIPIEWFHRVHDSSSRLMKTLRSTTLTTIPALRAIANDVIFDVLMYMTPAFCQSVLGCVTDQICDHYATFLEVNPNFRGKCSLVGHSLGSVICWDLLCVLQQQNEAIHEATASKEKEDDEARKRRLHPVSIPSQDSVEIGYQAYAASTGQLSDEGTGAEEEDDDPHNMAEHGTWGPTLVRPMLKTIPFVPECTMFLGSPLGLFLTLRGAHAVFESMRQEEIASLLSRHPHSPSDKEILHKRAPSPFHLPTNYLYNIFNPSDPVAYRIEPLLLSPHLDREGPDFPPPVYLTAVGKDVRLHVKARQIADDLQRSLLDQKSSWNALLDSTLTSFGPQQHHDASKARGDDHVPIPDWPPTFALGSPLHPKRVDYSFQPAIVENEYINAVTAHSSYFANADFQEFLISKLTQPSSPSP